MPIRVITDRAERVALKAAIAAYVTSRGSGPASAAPLDVVSQVLGWPASWGGKVGQLVREMGVDGDSGVLWALNDDGVYAVQTPAEADVAVKELTDVVRDYKKMAARLAAFAETHG